MHTKHLKSPCCQGKIYNFGQRRRQCSICKKTWRIRQKRRGRKTRRSQDKLIKDYLSNGGLNLEKYASKIGVSVPVLRYRIRKSLEYFLENEKLPEIPKRGKLICIADALIENIQGVQYTTYIILLRPVNKEVAYILEPQSFAGSENGEGWDKAFRTIPKQTRDRIIALVVDGKSCFKGISLHYGWLLQRCHFHLLAKLYHGIGLKKKNRNNKKVIELIGLTRQVITEKNDRKIKPLLE